MTSVDCFFDCSSPGTYLGFHRLIELQKELDFTINWYPIFIGGVFKTVNPGVFDTRATMPQIKADYYAKDFRDWEKLTGLKIVWPQPYHPINSVKAMRGVVVGGHHGKLVEVARATFEAYWRDGLNISDDAVLRDVCLNAGLNPELCFLERDTDRVKDELRRNGEELMARGGFGVPTMFVNGMDMYWGNDRMELVRAAIIRDASNHAKAG